MDKWKDIELEKMKFGGNQNARIFFESHDDYDENMSIQQKYNTKAAALYRDKVCTYIHICSVTDKVLFYFIVFKK